MQGMQYRDDPSSFESEHSYVEKVWVDPEIGPDELLRETTPELIDEDAGFANPLPTETIGPYRTPESRKLVTEEEEVLRPLVERGLYPGFLEAGPRELLRLDPCTVRAAIVAVGGTAPGTNAVIHAIVRRHTRYVEASVERWEQRGRQGQRPACTGRLLGFLNGFEGLMARQPWPAAAVPGPMELTLADTAGWRDTAGCQLGLSRYDFSAGDLVHQAAENVIAADLDIVYVIGGDGGMQGAKRLWEVLREHPKGLDVSVVGIPKTMDNDIGWARHSLGHGTALAEAARILNVLHTDAKANRRVMLVELFGADAGFVTAGAALASGKADLVLIREEAFDPWKTVAYIAKQTREAGCALVVMAEGALSSLGKRLVGEKLIELPKPSTTMLRDPWYERRDLHDAALKWLRDALRAEFVRPAVFTGHVVVNQPGYLIRAVPPSAEDIIHAERLGDLAVDSALAGYTGFMITQWQTHYVMVPLPLVVAVERRVGTEGAFWREVVSSTGQPSLASSDEDSSA